eukprot:gene55394-75908_t
MTMMVKIAWTTAEVTRWPSEMTSPPTSMPWRDPMPAMTAAMIGALEIPTQKCVAPTLSTIRCMGHHALILSDRAEVDAKPELEIYADDVSCAHGNTVGAMDEEALFYARQRGIPEAEARAMLTEAFIGQVIDRIWFEGA